MIIPEVKLILRARRTIEIFKFSNYTEKLIGLLLNIALLIFLGGCVYNFFENNFTLNPLFASKQTAVNGRLTLLDTMYFIVITMATVGYGDITPQTNAGKISIIILIILFIIIVPGLVSDLQEAMKSQKAGAGSFAGGGSGTYVIFCGEFKNPARFRRSMSNYHLIKDAIFGNDAMRVKIVILAREVLQDDVKSILSEHEFRDRVFYLVGKGFDDEDYNRIDLRYLILYRQSCICLFYFFRRRCPKR
jgi:hypothetical protein